MKIFYTIILFIFFSFFQFDLHSQVIINEVLPKNMSINIDPDYNDFSDWIELYNVSEKPVDLSGYFLTDSKKDTTKWQFPNGSTIKAKSFLLIWADDKNTKKIGLHSNFKLDASNEWLGLYNKDLSLIDSISINELISNISFGRKPDGSNHFGFFQKPTPQSSNNSIEKAGISTEPIFTLPLGIYKNQQKLIITSTQPNAEIRYTVNGDDPNERSLLYSDTINLKSTQVIKAIAIEKDKCPSKVKVRTYLINENISLPIISISTNPKNLWDDSIGIYVKGKNGIPGLGMSEPVNWNQDWERPAYIEYFDTLGQSVVNQWAGIKIFGGWSRANNQKSLAVYARNSYGKNDFEYPFFRDNPIDKFNSFILRNSGNDWGITMFRDGMMQTLVKGKMNIDIQDYQPVVVFLNGEYWGIHNLQQKINEEYITTNYNLKPDQIDLLEYNGNPLAGSSSHYIQFYDFLTNNDLSLKSNYLYVTSLIDIDEYIDYQITEIFIANTDWPGNNIKFWRPQTTTGRWRWILYDTDFGFSLYNLSYPSHNTLKFALATYGPDWPNPAWSTLVFRKLMENPDFKEKFINRFIFHLNSTFSIPRVINTIDSLKNNIASEMPRHITKWGKPFSMDDWDNNIAVLTNFAEERPKYLYQYIGDYIGIKEQVQIHFSIIGTGDIKINGQPLQGTDSSITYLKSYPLQIQAISNIDNFGKWKIRNIKTEESFLILKGEEWKYYDKGNINNSLWTTPDFNDNTWKKGKGKFGYGDGNEVTLISYGDIPTAKNITTYFRKSFFLSDTIKFNEAFINLLYDDGCIVYLNGHEVTRLNIPIGNTDPNTPSIISRNGDQEIIFEEFPIPTKYFVTGNNTITVELHQASPQTSDAGFDLELKIIQNKYYGEEIILDKKVIIKLDSNKDIVAVFQQDSVIKNEPPQLFINELMAVNDSAFTDEHYEMDDWIEIYNPNPFAVDLAGYFLTDDYGNPLKQMIPFDHPQKTIIEGYGYKILWADKDTTQGSLHLNFKLSSKEGILGLVYKKENDIIYLDSLSYNKQYSNQSIGRYPDGNFKYYQFFNATPGFSNIPNIVPPPSGVVFYEIMTSNKNLIRDNFGEYENWFELWNKSNSTIYLKGLYFTDDPTNLLKYQIPDLKNNSTSVDPDQLLVFWADGNTSQGLLHLGFKLSNSSNYLALVMKTDYDTLIITDIHFPEQPVNQSYAIYPNRTKSWQLTNRPTPGAMNKFEIISPNGITNSNFANQIQLFPNPVSKNFLIRLNQNNFDLQNINFKTDIWLTNISGTKINLQPKILDRNTVEFNISNVASGIYILTFNISGNFQKLKIIKL